MSQKDTLALSIRRALALGVGAGLFAVSGVTMAQDTQATEEEAQAEERVERIQVTGSRIARPGDISPTPLTVITGEGLVDAGVVNVADLLHRMPNTLVGLSPETTNNTIFASGLNNTDLRGLGANRTLVLVNGRRFIAGAPGSAAVDLNNIPTSMIERVEITTGGASAVYGSDAVAGVVNIITKRRFDGVEVDVSTIRPFESGGEEDFFSLTFGSDVGGANFVTNLNIVRSGQLSAMDRDFLRNSPIVLRNPEFNANYDNEEHPDYRVGEPNSLFLWGYGEQRLAQYSRTGDFGTVFGDRYSHDADGTFRDFDFGEPLPYLLGSGRQDYIGPGDGYNFSENTWYRTPLNRVNFTSHMNYEFNENHSMNLEVNFAKTDAYGESSPAFLAFLLRPDNAFLSPEAQAIVQQDWDDRAALRAGTFPGFGAFPTLGAGTVGTYLASDFGNRQYSQDRYLARAALSFEGYLVNDWMYDVYATVGHVQSDTEWYGEIFEDRFYDAIDAVEIDGEIVCRSALARSQGCAPLNIFGTEQYSEEAYDWVSTDAIRRASIGQTVIGGSVTGDLMELPAGYLQAAFSAEYREERATTLPDPAMRAGMLFNNMSSPLRGKFDVVEVAAEFSIPLIQDAPFMQQVNLDVAARFMDYSTSGTDNAWKVGLNWEVNDDWRLRFNHSKSVRAPNIGELFNPPGQTFASLFDVCDSNRVDELNPEFRDQIQANCDAQGRPDGFVPSAEWYGSTRPGFIVGNPDLENEEAKDITIGFVYTPRALPDFSMTVDYWSFEVTNAITSVAPNTLINLCYRSSTLDNPYCPLLERDPDSFEIVNFFQTPVNSAYSEISGFDLEAAYGLETGFGDFGFRLIGTYLNERISNATGLPEDEIDSTGEQARPRWRHRFITSYAIGDFSTVLTMTHRTSTVASNQWSPNQNNYNDIPSYTQWDLTSRYNVNNNLQVRLGILNLLDENPPRLPAAFSQGQYYDLLGRRLTLGVNYKF